MDIAENKTLREGDDLDKKIRADLLSKLYKCESCGNFLRFDPTIGKLKCDHCDSVYDIIQVGNASELKYTSLSEQGFEPWEEKAIKCNACGAVSILGKCETTLRCPFCDATNIADIDDFEGVKPNAILPFKIDQATANTLQKKWIKKRLFAPSRLKKDALTKNIRGIYIPCFTFDTSTFSSYTIRYGQTYTVTTGSGKNKRTTTHTRWFVDSGTIGMNFDDIQIEVSDHLSQKQRQKIGGFDTANCVKYHSQYVAGFSSERYNRGLDDCWDDAQQMAYDQIKKSIIARYRADRIDYVNISVDHSNVTYKYALVPIWVLNYAFKNKSYGCVINGRNGAVAGKTPLSWIKTLLTTLVGLGVVGVIGWLVYQFLL